MLWTIRYKDSDMFIARIISTKKQYFLTQKSSEIMLSLSWATCTLILNNIKKEHVTLFFDGDWLDINNLVITQLTCTDTNFKFLE